MPWAILVWNSIKTKTLKLQVFHFTKIKDMLSNTKIKDIYAIKCKHIFIQLKSRLMILLDSCHNTNIFYSCKPTFKKIWLDCHIDQLWVILTLQNSLKMLCLGWNAKLKQDELNALTFPNEDCNLQLRMSWNYTN